MDVYYNDKRTTDKPKGEPNNYYVDYADFNIILLRTTLCCKKGLLPAYLGFKRAF